MMRIEFYRKATGEVVPTLNYFVLNGDEVWCDNFECFESQSESIGFEDCIKRCDGIGWRVAED